MKWSKIWQIKVQLLFKETLEIPLSIAFSGAYAPITMEGNISVNGVLASCYASTDHDLAHIGMTPLRWFPKMTSWIFGEETEIKMSRSIAKELGKWLITNEY